MKIRSLALIFLATFCLHASISVRTAELSVNGKNLILKNKISGDWKSAPLSIALFDGKAKKFIDLPAPAVSEKDGKIILSYKMPELTWDLVFSIRNRVILGESTFVNKGKKELFLEQIFSLTPDWKNNKLMFWDGFGISRKIGREPISRKGIKGAVLPHISASDTAFAATAVYSEKNAVSIGHVTFDPVSYTAVEYIPAEKKYSYSQRFVISAGEKLPLRHVIAVSESAYLHPPCPSMRRMK